MNPPLSQALKEERAFEKQSEWIAKGKETIQAFRDAGLPLSPGLKRYLGEETTDGLQTEIVSDVVPPLNWPEKPPSFKDGWIFVAIGDLFITSLVLGILRTEDGPMKPAAVHEKAIVFDSAARMMAVYNVLSRLTSRDTLVKEADGWVLKATDHAPVFCGKYAWGPASVFVVQEQASYRRFVLLHVLESRPAGTQIMQLVKLLESYSDFKLTAVTKDQLADDLEIMRKSGLVERDATTRQWRRKGPNR